MILMSMNGEEIANELGITRQGVSQTLRKAVKKLFEGIKRIPDVEDSYEAFILMQEFLKIPTAEDTKDLLKMLPKKYREEIETNARNRVAERRFL